MSVMVLTTPWKENLLREIEDADYCYVCGEHPSHGHKPECPVIKVTDNS